MNTQPVTEHPEVTTDEHSEAMRTELMTNDHDHGKEGTSPAPTLMMVNADDGTACTGDGCAVTLRKG